MNLRKTVLALSVSAGTSMAMAADKVPTLGDVLKASGVDVSGYIDYSHNNLSTDSGSNTYRVFDTEKRGFNLQMLDVTVSSLPASGVGGMVELNYGSDAQVIHSFGTNNFNGTNATATSSFDVSQAYLQYANGPLNLMAGKYVTLAGAEVIRSPDDTNFSRSFMFGYAIPFTHTGVRASYSAGDVAKFVVGLNNGWDVAKESGQPTATNGKVALGKTLELGASGSPTKMISYAVAYYTGDESFGQTEPAERKLLDAVLTLNATDALSFVLNYDKAEQAKVAPSGTTAKWNGLAGYANYKFNDIWRLSFRTEKFEDKNCYRTGCTTGKQTLKGNTLTVGYMAAKSLELRGEYRKDKSDKNVFTESGSLKKTQNSLGFEAIYKF